MLYGMRCRRREKDSLVSIRASLTSASHRLTFTTQNWEVAALSLIYPCLFVYLRSDFLAEFITSYLFRPRL